MAKQKLKATAKKTLAVISTAALILSCSTTGLFTVSAAEIDGKTVSADSKNAATKMYIYDENGNDITNSPIVYLDNTSAAGQATSTYVTVKISNDGDTLNDSIVCSTPSVNESDKHFSVSGGVSYNDGKEVTAIYRIDACKYVASQTNDPITGEPIKYTKEEPYKPGRDNIKFFTDHTEIARNLQVVVLEPATDMRVYRNNRNLAMSLNDDTSGDISEDSRIMNNTTAIEVIANHPVQLYTSLISPTNASTDEVEWSVYDDFFNQKDLDAGFEPVPATTNAEIDESGYFTPKQNSKVTIVANFKATDRAAREYEIAMKNYEDGKLEEEPVFVSDRIDAIGTKSRSVRNAMSVSFLDGFYTLAYNDSGRILYNSEPATKTITSNQRASVVNGNFVVSKTTFTPPYPVVKNINNDTGAITYSRDDNNGSIMPIDLYKPVYTDLKTVPKYIHVYIIKENPAKEMSFSKTTSAMEIGETFQMELNVVPTFSGVGYESGATDVFTWESNNPAIATVDQNGVVTALQQGDVKITAKSENANVFTSTNITVLTKAKSISITPAPTSTRVDATVELTATMNPEDANDEIIWESKNPEIAVVESVSDGQLTNPQKAVVTGKGVGFTEIVAKAKNSGVEAICRVNVNEKILSDNLTITTNNGEKIAPVSEGSTLTVYTDQEINIDAALTAADGVTPDDKVMWKISDNDNDTVTISSQDSTHIKLRGNTEGKIKVTAYSEANPDKVTKSFYVEVLRKCDYITIFDSNNNTLYSKNINVNNSLSLHAEMKINGNYPYNHKDTIKSWTSSNEKVATVSNTGTVEALSVGEAVITVTTSSGQKSSVTVNVFITSSVSINDVKASVDGKELPTSSITIGSNKTFNATVRSKNDAIYGVDCEWSSSDESVATITNTGYLTANNVGSTIITVKSGAQSESCLLTVTSPLYNITNEEIPAYTYSPSVEAYEPKPVLTLNGSVLVENKDYTVEYFNNTGVGYATVRVKGIGNFTDYKDINFSIVSKQLTESDIIISTIENQECTGNSITPEVTITYQDTTLELGKDYYVSYNNNVSPSKEEQPAQVIINGQGNYTGTAIQTFNIYCNHKELRDTIITKEPTYQNTGLQEGYCTVCGERVTTAVPAKKFLGIYGDVDNSGSVDSADALAILRNSVQLDKFDELQLKLADVDKDGSISSSDALLVLRKSVGLTDSNSVAGQDYN